MLLNKNAIFCEVYIKITNAPFYIKKPWSDIKGSHFDHLIFKCFTDDGSLASLEVEDY